MKKSRRILLPVLLGLCLGWLAGWMIDIFLEPKPVIEVQLRPGYGALIYNGGLNVGSIVDKSTSYYQLSDGACITFRDGTFSMVQDRPQPIITKPAQKIIVTDAEPTFYFTRALELVVNGRPRFIYFDPVHCLSYRFHGYREEDQHDEVFGHMNRRSRYCLLRRHLPFNALLCGGLIPHDSPASLLLAQVAKVTPFSSPSLHTIVTIPEKHIVSQFVLDGSWGNAQVALSPNGSYVACIRSEADITNEAFEGLKFSCFWDVHKERWMKHLPDVSRSALKWSPTFLNDEIYAGQTQQSATSLGFDEFNLLNIATGQLLDLLNGVSVNYFVTRQTIKGDDGSWWYLKQSDRKNYGLTYTLKRIKNSLELETIGKYSWEHAEVGMALTQGLQSIVPTNGHSSFTEFIKAKLGNNSFYRTIEPWIVRPSTSIYDWKTGRTYVGWTGNHRWQMSSNGEYLLIVHQIGHEEQTKQGTLAQVFQMPLTFYSPWWSRVSGILAAVMFFCLFWRWQTKRLFTSKG